MTNYVHDGDFRRLVDILNAKFETYHARIDWLKTICHMAFTMAAIAFGMSAYAIWLAVK